MSRILVTGADGFIGSHLVEHLLSEGHSVRALALYNSFNNWGWLEDVGRHEHLQVVTGDIRDPFLCEKITEGMDVVLNLAALIAIPYSYQAPQSYIETNISGTLNLCQAALKNKVRRFIQTSTSEVYGTARYVPIDEKHPLQPQSPYSASKISSDAMSMSYFHAFGLPVTVARPFNTYGPRQSARAVIPTIITQLANGKKEIHLGKVSPTRDFNFVKDTARGIWGLAQSEKTIGQTVNIGSGEEHSIEATFNSISRLMNVSAKIVTDEARMRPEASEVDRLLCDQRLIKELIGYQPQFSFENGLKETIAWFTKSQNLAKYKSDIYNV